MSLTIAAAQYDLPNPPSKLKHKRMNLFQWLLCPIMRSHVCQICGRKEAFVSGWRQIDHPVYKDHREGSCVCFECEAANPEVFNNPTYFQRSK